MGTCDSNRSTFRATIRGTYFTYLSCRAAPFLHKLGRGVATHRPCKHAYVRVSARFRSAPARSQSDRHELVFLVLTSLTMLVGPWCTRHHLVRASLARGAPVASPLACGRPVACLRENLFLSFSKHCVVLAKHLPMCGGYMPRKR